MHWADLRRDLLDVADRATPVVFPVAAIEQHGSHLPLSTDVRIVEAVATRLDRAFDGRLLILPTVSVGCSEHHMAFAGTLTITHETFRRLVMDVVESAVRHGFRRFLVLNGHGGNIAICGILGEQIGQRWPEVECLVTNWWTPAMQRLQGLQEGPLGSVGHACEFETSILMAVAPELVAKNGMRDDGVQPRTAALHFDLLHGSAAGFYRPFHAFSTSGVFGMPSLASPEKGDRVLAEAVEALRLLLSDFWPDIPGQG